MTTDAKDFYLNSNSNVVKLETLEITHPDFLNSYFVVRNKVNGLTATLETAVVQEFTYLPMSITEGSVSTDLSYSLNIEFGDLGGQLPFELDAVYDADGMATYPTVIYRAFRSDDLSAPMIGPIELKIYSLSFNKTGTSFEAVTDRSNSSKTGERYNVARFPLLLAFIDG